MRICSRFALAPFVQILLSVMQAGAQQCVSTPEAAARAVVGTEQATAHGATIGYRASGVQFDPVMRRLWVRVQRCGIPSAPFILVPLRADLAGDAQRSQQALFPSSAALEIPIAAASAQPAVRAGDSVTVVFLSDSVHLQIQGIAGSTAALGGRVEVALKPGDGEVSHRMYGIARADHRVEVQP